MRLVSWNCCDGFERKFGHLERLHPDIAVISEARPECLKSAGLLEQSYWVGEPGQKGLAVIPYNGWKITGTGPVVNERWFAPLVLTNADQQVQLVGVWLNDGADYVMPTLKAWETLAPFVATGPSVLAGDFNQSVGLDKNRAKGRRFADVLDLLHGAGLRSAWHTATGEAHGSESQATLYWRWQEASRFHIDYVFYPTASMRVERATLGSYQQYIEGRISDHVPLVVDLAS